MKNHYKLIAVDLSQQKQLHADLQGIQQIQFVGQLKNADNVSIDGVQSMFVLTILETIKTQLKLSQGSVAVTPIWLNG